MGEKTFHEALEKIYIAENHLETEDPRESIGALLLSSEKFTTVLDLEEIVDEIAVKIAEIQEMAKNESKTLDKKMENATKTMFKDLYQKIEEAGTAAGYNLSWNEGRTRVVLDPQ